MTQYTHRDLEQLIDLYFNVISPATAEHLFEIIIEIKHGMSAKYEGVIVTHGEVVVDHVRMIHNTDDFKVWEGDLDTKYAAFAYASDPLTIMLYADPERTIKLDETKRGKATFVDLGLNSYRDGWRVVCDVARYTMYLAAYRYAKDYNSEGE